MNIHHPDAIDVPCRAVPCRPCFLLTNILHENRNPLEGADGTVRAVLLEVAPGFRLSDGGGIPSAPSGGG